MATDVAKELAALQRMSVAALRELTNVVYTGKVRYKAEVHDGEHPAIVDPGIFQRAQALLKRNGSTGGAPVRNQFGALLKGLLKCVPCGCAMTPSHASKHGRRYRCYLCSSAQKKGWAPCPSKTLPAQQIEALVVDRIRCVGRDPELLRWVPRRRQRPGGDRDVLAPRPPAPGPCSGVCSRAR
jgi:site-specific DNA recombinase